MAQRLPIFELPLVLLPGEELPLHIFEERYKRMIGRALEAGEPFGVLLRDDEGAHRIGCTAHVTEVLESFEDGRLNIVATGAAPFRVLDRLDDPEDLAAEVEVIQPGPGGGDPEAAASAREALAELAERAGAERPDAAELDAEGAFALAARIELPAATKQRLLELPDEGERMRLLARALGALREALEGAEAIAALARSNGRGRPSGAS